MNKHLLPVVKDRLGILYVDKAEILQKDFCVIISSDGQIIDVPIATLLCIMLGPGTSISHGAVKAIADVGCTLIWVGENLNYYYAFGKPLTSLSTNILKQCACHESKLKAMDVVHKLYEIRYPNLKLKTKSLNELCGLEGLYVKQCYADLARMYNVEWDERTYHVDDFESQSDINKAITTANQSLYALITSIINMLGFSTAIAFVHSSNVFSFVYDIADLYKEKYIFPAVFEWIGQGNTYSSKELRIYIHNRFMEWNLIENVVDVLTTLFEI